MGERRIGNLVFCDKQDNGLISIMFDGKRPYNQQTRSVSFQETTLSCEFQVERKVNPQTVANCQNIYCLQTSPWARVHASAAQSCRLPTAQYASVSGLFLRPERSLGYLRHELRGTKDSIDTANIFYWAAWSSSYQAYYCLIWVLS